MKKLVKRSDKVAYYGIKQADGSVIYKKMLGFSELNVSKNPKEYTRQYTTDDFETTSVIGYSPSMSFAFDRYKGNDVQDDIVNIFDNEITGTLAVREILMVDKNKPLQSGFKCVKRPFCVVCDNEGSSTDAYTYAGTFKSKGKAQEGIAIFDISQKAVFLKKISSENFDDMTTYDFANFVSARAVAGGYYNTSYLELGNEEYHKNQGKILVMDNIQSRTCRIKMHDFFGKREFSEADIGRTFKIYVSLRGALSFVRLGIFEEKGTSPLIVTEQITELGKYNIFELDYTVTANSLKHTLIGIEQTGKQSKTLYIDDIYVYEYENHVMPVMTLDEVLEETAEAEEKESTETEETAEVEEKEPTQTEETDDATEIQS